MILTGIRMIWIGTLLLVVVASLLPMPSMAEMPAHSDKFAHFAAYATLGLLAMLSLSGMRKSVLAAAAMVALGIAVELVQGVLPWRSFEWLDIAANTIGVLAGSALALAVMALGFRTSGADPRPVRG
jgi:VanZ family protein